MTGLVLKLSYNKIGETPVTGGICGSFFFGRPDLAITANHVLNKNEFKPNLGFNLCQFWLVAQPNIVIELNPRNFIEHPEIDTTFIKLSKKHSVPIRNFSSEIIDAGHECYNEGFIGGSMPELNASWAANGLKITGCKYNNTIANGIGQVKSRHTLDINAADIKMTNVIGLATSYGGIKGMSGGPLVSKRSNEIIGLMSIGLPADVEVKDSLFAVSINEINDKIKNVA